MSLRLVLLDWSLVDRSGHASEYGRNVIEAFAANKLQVTVYGHRKCIFSTLGGAPVRPWFSRAPTDPVTAVKPLRPVAKIAAHWWRSGAELAGAVGEEDGENTLFFIQHTDSYQLPGIIRAFAGAKGRLILMLRTTSLVGAGQAQRPSFRTWLYRLFLPKLATSLGPRLSLVTDSVRLRDEYVAIANHPITVVPIPNPSAASRAAHTRREPATVMMAGRMSFEKGIHYLPELIRKSRARGMPLRFLIHAYCHSSEVGAYEAIRAELESLRGPDLELVGEPRSTEGFWADMRRSDFCLLLYNVARYRNQTSNLVLDALASGAFPIVSAGTWLSDTVASAGFGASVPVTSDKAATVDRTLDVLGAGIPPMRSSKIDEMLAYHTAENFRDEVLSLCLASALARKAFAHRC